MKKKRIYRSLLGIPIYLYIGFSIFVIFSVVYDLVVGDRNWERYALLIIAIIVLIMSFLIQSTSLRTIKNIAKKQLGG